MAVLSYNIKTNDTTSLSLIWSCKPSRALQAKGLEQTFT